MRSHASTTVESIKKYDDLKITLSSNQDNTKYHNKKNRSNSQNKDNDSRKMKENYMGRILEKKTKMLHRTGEN